MVLDWWLRALALTFGSKFWSSLLYTFLLMFVGGLQVAMLQPLRFLLGLGGGGRLQYKTVNYLLLGGADAHFTHKYPIFFRGVVDPWTYIESTCTSSLE